MGRKPGTTDLANNKKAYHLYSFDDEIEAGIVLTGTEVKSCRNRSINFQDAYAEIRGGEVFLKNLHIGLYKNGTVYNHDPLNTRKLLLHKKEIIRMTGRLSQRGLSLIPLKLYLKGSLIKVLLGLGRGKKEYEKRDDIRKREAQVEIDKAMKNSLRKIYPGS